MKPIINVFVAAFAALCIFVVLASFAPKPGGDSFEVYIDHSLILKQFMHGRTTTPSLVLDESTGEEMTVIYSHCGVTGTSRKITLKDQQNRMLKEWRFADVDPKIKNAMAVKIKDISSFKKGNQGLGLFYSATEAKEVMLAPIEWSSKTASTN